MSLNELHKMNCFEINGYVYYVGYDESKNILYAGSCTNCGVIHEYEINYDHDCSLEANLQYLYGTIIEDLIVKGEEIW